MKRGFSMTELLVALAIVTMACTASTLAALSVPAVIADARSASDALQGANLGIEFASSTTDIALEDENVMRRVSRMLWTSVRGAPHQIELFTLIASSTLPAACDPFTSGDWRRPQLINSYQLNSGGLLPSFSGTYTIAALAISPNILTIAIASSSQANTPTLFLFNITGTSAPQLLGSFDNASSSRIGNSSVAVDGVYAYAGNAFSSASQGTCRDGASCAQINTYQMQSVAHRISSLTLATTSVPYALLADGSSAPASALTYYHKYLFLGLQKTARGYEFNIIDAHDPFHLRWTGGMTIGRTITSITVRNNLAYVSTDDPTRELMVIDVQDPTAPVLRASWDAPGSSTFGYGSASTVYENTIRFGRTYTSNGPEFELLKLADNGITESEHIDSGTTKDPESVRALVTQDRLTFMLLTHRLDILDTHTPSHVKSISTYQLPASTRGIALACRNNQLYLARNTQDGQGFLDILQGS